MAAQYDLWYLIMNSQSHSLPKVTPPPPRAKSEFTEVIEYLTLSRVSIQGHPPPRAKTEFTEVIDYLPLSTQGHPPLWTKSEFTEVIT